MSGNNEIKVNYVAIVEQTFTEKVEMYMQCEKEQLARMLAIRDMQEQPKANDDGIDNNMTYI